MTIDDDDIIGTWSSFVVMASSLPHALADLTSFRAREVINDGRDVHGRVGVLGAFDGCDEDALVKLQRSPLPHDLDGVRALLRRVRLRARAPYSGAEYGYYVGDVERAREGEEGDGDVECDVLYPGCLSAEAEAREKLLRKHVTRNSTQRVIVVRETPKMYEEAHERYISSIPREATAWVRKILSLEKEKERLLHVDDEFLLNTDPKWTTHPECATTARETWMGHPSVVDLYCLAIAMDENLRSLRDVRARHLPALRAMLSKGREVIARVYGVRAEDMRVYVHYPPQFYHFHVHFQALSAKEVGCATERAHQLEDVIDNVERDGDFYAKANLSLKMGERDHLYELYSSS